MSKRYCPQCESVLTVQPQSPITGYCTKCNWCGGVDEFLTEFKPNSTGPKTDWTPYVSIDLETTGLDAEYCQILEFGAVIDDWHSPIDKLPRFHRDILPNHGVDEKPYICGQPYALALNADILRRIHNNGGTDETVLGPEFAEWLDENGMDPKHITAAGKNFASFDRSFLEVVPGFSDHVCFRHRSIDPAIFYWRPDIDDNLPSTKTCLKRAGLDGRVAHTAVEDCISVIQLIRRGVRKCALSVSE